jgi:hypothetical protein
VALGSASTSDAARLFTSARDIFTRIEAPYEQARATYCLAEAHAAAADHEQAARLRAEALDRAARIGARLPRTEG